MFNLILSNFSIHCHRDIFFFTHTHNRRCFVICFEMKKEKGKQKFSAKQKKIIWQVILDRIRLILLITMINEWYYKRKKKRKIWSKQRKNMKIFCYYNFSFFFVCFIIRIRRRILKHLNDIDTFCKCKLLNPKLTIVVSENYMFSALYKKKLFYYIVVKRWQKQKKLKTFFLGKCRENTKKKKGTVSSTYHWIAYHI